MDGRTVFRTRQVPTGQIDDHSLLERIGTAEAKQVVKALAEGALEVRLTREAKAALKRLARRPVSEP